MSRILVEDTRQQAGKHKTKREWWEQNEIEVLRSKLPFGDYALLPGVAVDTKKDILELCTDIDQQHERFRRECVGARDAGCKLIVLVENNDGITDLSTLVHWKNPRAYLNALEGKRPPIDGKRLAKACATMQKKYGVRFEFCTPEESAKRILELLGFDNEQKCTHKRTP